MMFINLHKEGFVNLCAGLDEFLTENNLTFDGGFGYIKIYSSVAVESTDIIRTAKSSMATNGLVTW